MGTKLIHFVILLFTILDLNIEILYNIVSLIIHYTLKQIST